MATLDNGPPRGTRDLLPAVVARRESVVSSIAQTYARYGFRRIETPSIESAARLSGGQGGENEKLVYQILRRGLPGEITEPTAVRDLVDLALRFDLTVPLTRFFANNQAELPVPFRALQIGNVWRAERPARGRYRQFTQCDIDVIGEDSVLAECELLEATAAALLGLGIEPVTIRVNDRRLLTAVANESGVGVEEMGGFFVTLDKLDKIGWDGVGSELGSRGFAPGVAINARRLVELIASAEDQAEMLDRAGGALASLEPEVLDGLRATTAALDRLAANDPRLSSVFDPTIVRGMGYYTGQIFEVTHPSSDSSIAGGGRYDGLVGRSLGREVSACGISIGFDRVVELAQVPPVDLGVAVLYGDEPAEDVLAAARTLRASGRPAALVPRKKSVKAQLDSLGAEGYSGFVLFEGGAPSTVRSLGGEAPN